MTSPLRSWAGARRPGPPVAAATPTVVTDLHVQPRSTGSLQAVTATLRGSCDAVLVGDHGGARNDFPPSHMALLLRDAGVGAWVTLSCRDRNRVALAAELAALADVGVVGVHCVTGDWQGLAGASGERKVFDLECLYLIDQARSAGLLVSVAGTPAAPPVELRPRRLAEKVAAGAQVCFVNHCGGPGPVRRYIEAAHEAGAAVPFIACVAVTGDRGSLTSLARLPGIVLDQAAEREAQSDASGTVDVAVAAAARMLDVEGVAGVNLSGAASSASYGASAAIMAAVGARLLGRSVA
ncbi:methylenetetrahydrofolate reductase [Acidiferrimicrobium sp. IK]|uniref:methylenetetrahydrofolate reductase n=1 Tax=Acidiferrimicrobium sp. IK TaxID=2871700 RepID=UPI0021CB97F5|nr:methylenetetrahydrofolate reductase [Acidiferrimicrobium sp. IK]